MGFICVGVVSQSHEDTMVQAGVSVTWAVMAIVSVGAGVLVIARSGKALGKERYNVTIVSSAGEKRALTSEDQEYIRRIVGAINEAIVRG
jgi:hypothetical protein